MLFSEPKIPQCITMTLRNITQNSFSALQRAENSSMYYGFRGENKIFVFQCSSASRKFLNLPSRAPYAQPAPSFSALQRAENSSIVTKPASNTDREPFQCSSASRKFLNARPRSGSARPPAHVSVLFSEPKIPQLSSVVLPLSM